MKSSKNILKNRRDKEISDKKLRDSVHYIDTKHRYRWNGWRTYEKASPVTISYLNVGD